MPRLPSAPVENGSELPFSPDLRQLSDGDLTELITHHHAAFAGSVRRAIRDHARMAGAALLEMKSRIGHGGWSDWLAANFKGSAETARVYMRIAKNWGQLVADGVDREDVTLEQLRWALAEPAKRTPPLNIDDDGSTAADPQDDDSLPPRPPAPRSQIREVKLYLTADNRDDFDRMVEHLKPALKTDNVTDTVRKAVRFCYEEKCRG